MSWIQTYTGLAFDVLDPTPEMVSPDDLAHALAHVNRYTGHARWPLSVAEHSVMVMWAMDTDTELDTRHLSPEEQRTRRLYALLHDASEAYICDVPRPIKPLLAGYAEMEARVMRTVLHRFECDPTEDDVAAVRRADYRMLETERRQVMGPPPMPWSTSDVDPYYFTVECWPGDRAEREFLNALRGLTAA